MGGTTQSRNQEFEAFYREAEPRLRRALVAGYGPDRGRDAAAAALAWALENWHRVQHMTNPVGYLYRVGASSLRTRRPGFQEARTVDGGPGFEPELADALASLSVRQRQAVVLVYGMGWPVEELARSTHTSASSVRVHLRRGLRRLRTQLGVDLDEESP